MFNHKKSDEMSLSFSCKIIFAQPTYLGSDFCKRHDSNSHATNFDSNYIPCTTLEDIRLIYNSVRTDADNSKKDSVLEIKVTGSLLGKNINKCFSTVNELDSFMEENNLLLSKDLVI